jgi:hypothetical protein
MQTRKHGWCLCCQGTSVQQANFCYSQLKVGAQPSKVLPTWTSSCVATVLDSQRNHLKSWEGGASIPGATTGAATGCRGRGMHREWPSQLAFNCTTELQSSCSSL